MVSREDGSSELGSQTKCWSGRVRENLTLVTTAHEIENKSGLDFYWHLEDELEGKIESGQQGDTLAQEHLGCSTP